MAKRLLLGVVAGILFSLFAVYPQFRLHQIRGAEYAGAFASCDLDEMAYASYVQALIDGRSRKNDPYTGRDSDSENPQPESLFSIQFVPSYLSAIPARAFGLSAPQMMPVISVASAFLTALALFWLILSVTKDEMLSFAGTMIVLLFGALIVGIGAINVLSEGGIAYPFFPMLRRPIPSLGFPLLFSFFACIWNGLEADNPRTRRIFLLAAAACFALMVFSYFYLWSAAAAVLAALVFWHVVLPYEKRGRDLRFLVSVGLVSAAALIPYAALLADRSELADKAQLLVFTRQPDLLRWIELLGVVAVALAVTIYLARVTTIGERIIQFVAALGLSPLIAFNQQIITGRSLQPFHYEFYVINYVVLLALVLLAAVFWRRYIAGTRSLAFGLILFISSISLIWGYVEATQTTEFWDETNIRRDKAMPVNTLLRQLAGDINTARSQTTLNLEQLQADSQTTVAPQPVLWARHQHTFAGLASWEENKRRYYQFLYYADLTHSDLREALTNCSDIEACIALFGWDRFNPRLSANARPITTAEIEAEVANFERFSRDFSAFDAREPTLSFVIDHNNSLVWLKNLDRWYERDSGETLGDYTLYRVTLRELPEPLIND